MKKMGRKGIIILQAERMAIGRDLVSFGLVAGEEARLLGSPCFVLYGFTKKGFELMRRTGGAALSESVDLDASNRSETCLEETKRR